MYHLVAILGRKCPKIGPCTIPYTLFSFRKKYHTSNTIAEPFFVTGHVPILYNFHLPLVSQERLGQLSSECRGAIESYTRVEAKNVKLNTAVARACHEVIDKECAEEVSGYPSKCCMRAITSRLAKTSAPKK